MSQKKHLLERCLDFSLINNHLGLLFHCLYLNPTARSATCQHFQIQQQLLPDFPVRSVFLFFYPSLFLFLSSVVAEQLRKLGSRYGKVSGFLVSRFASNLPFFFSLFVWWCAFGLLETGGSYFSLAQWQELELQALIFRHMLAGAAVPPELLQLIKKSLLNPPPYYLQHPLQHYQHYQPACKLSRFSSPFQHLPEW